MSQTPSKTEFWTLAARFLGLGLAIIGPFIGYAIATLKETDQLIRSEMRDANKDSAMDRSQLRERVAGLEVIATGAKQERAEIKTFLARIEAKLDRHMAKLQDATP